MKSEAGGAQEAPWLEEEARPSNRTLVAAAAGSEMAAAAGSELAVAAASFLGLPRPPPCLRLGGMGGIGGGGGEGGGQAGGGGGGGVFWNRIEPNPRVCLCWARLVGPRVSHRLGVGGRWVGVRGARRSVSHARGFGFGGWASQSFDFEPRGCWNLWGRDAALARR